MKLEEGEQPRKTAKDGGAEVMEKSESEGVREREGENERER